MNSHDLRRTIDQKIAEEDGTGFVMGLLQRVVPAERCASTLDFIKAYVAQSPEVLDAVYGAAKKANVLERFQPIFDAAFNYWTTEYDFIPDNQNGLLGICDDAYMTQSFMHVAANTKLSSGSPLLEMNLHPSNLVMRGIIGEPIASQLDAAVAQAFGGATFQNALAALLAQVGAGSLPVDFGGMGGGMSDYELQHEVDVRLGAMGVV